MFFALLSRLPALFRFRFSMPPRLCAPALRLTRPLPLPRLCVPHPPPPPAPNRRSSCFLPPRRLRFVECPRGPRGGNTVACSRSQAGPHLVELQLPGSAAKDQAEDRAALRGRGRTGPRRQGSRLPSNRSVSSFGEAIEDRSGMGSPWQSAPTDSVKRVK